MLAGRFRAPRKFGVHDLPLRPGKFPDEGKATPFTLSGSDADPGTFLSYTIVAPPAHGTLTGTGPTHVYTPEAGTLGADSFRFIVHDGGFESAPATVSITITPATGPAAPPPVMPEFVDPNPSENNGFGQAIVALTTGNVVITSPQADLGGVTDCGAVYLFNGSTGALISTLTGTTAYDYVGNGGVTALTNGNFVVRSPAWDHGTTPNVGAVTWANGTVGIVGTVAPDNSLTGTTAHDQVGSGGVNPLPNGDYTVHSPDWNHRAGTTTLGDGEKGTRGPATK